MMFWIIILGTFGWIIYQYNLFMHLLYTYLLIISAIGIFLMAKDKISAIKSKYRTPEITLIAVASLGGAVVMWPLMYIIKHKIRKPLFYIGFPTIFALQLILCWVFATFEFLEIVNVVLAITFLLFIVGIPLCIVIFLMRFLIMISERFCSKILLLISFFK